MKLLLKDKREFEGRFMRIELAKFNRKTQLVLTLDIGDTYLNVPINEIESLIDYQYFKEANN